MSKGDTFENDFLKLIFNAIAIANIGDNAVTSPLTNLYLALHTADPGETGTQATSECTYTGYARQPVARTSGGFTVTANQVFLAALLAFPMRTDAASQTATHFSIGVAVSGATKLLYKGAFTTPSGGIVITQNTIPQIGTTQALVTED